MFTASPNISSGTELVWTMIPGMQKSESFFWPPQIHISAPRSKENLHETDLLDLLCFSHYKLLGVQS